MTAYSVATALAAACGLVFPLSLMGRDLFAIMRNLREGGSSMWLLLLLVPVIPMMVALLSSMAIRGRRVPPIAIVGVALFPALVAFVGTTMSSARMSTVLAGDAIDPIQKVRIAFEGASEAMAALQFGAAISAFALGAAAVGCAGIAASVDRERVGAKTKVTWMVSVTIPVIGLFASVGVMFATRSLGTSLYPFGLSLVSMVMVAILSPLTALVSPAFRDWHDPTEQRRMLSAIVCAAVSAALAMWLLDRVGMLGTERLVLGACSGESVDPAQRAHILMEGRAESHAFVLLAIVQAPCALFAFAPSVLRGMNKGRSPLDMSGGLAITLTLMVALGFVATEANATSVIRQVALSIPRLDLPDLLPAVKDGRVLRSAQGTITILNGDGTLREGARYASPVRSLDSRTFAADKSTPVAQLLARMRTAPAATELRMDLVVQDARQSEVDLTALDPDIRAMLTTEPAVVSTIVNNSGPGVPSVAFMTADTVIVRSVNHASTTITFGPEFETELRVALGVLYGHVSMVVSVRADTTVDALVRVISSAGSSDAPDVYLKLSPSP